MAQVSVTGNILDIKSYSIHDGPGIRTTVFFKGCPVRCLWCANPESMRCEKELSFYRSRCVECKQCISVCPVGAVQFIERRRIHDKIRCQSCGRCVEVCQEKALEILGRKVSVEDIMEELLADRPFWSRSGGGVTLSGGEVLMQPEFARNVLKKCQTNYIHTAIETSLHASEKVLESIEPYVDYFMCDLKVVDEKRHIELTGVSNRLILSNMEKLLEGSKSLLIRMPLVPGWNNDKKNLEETGRFLESHRNGVELEILPYHRYGESKYERLGLSYALGDVKSPSPDEMAIAQDILSGYDIRLVST